MKPGPTTRKTVDELFIPGTEPTRAASITVTADVDAATGLLWRDGCAGPMVTRSFIDLSRAESGFPAWQKADAAWQARAARGSGVAGGPKHTRTSYFYGGGFYPYGTSWGGSFAPTKKCPTAPPPPTVCVPDLFNPCPSEPAITPPPNVPPGGARERQQADPRPLIVDRTQRRPTHAVPGAATPSAQSLTMVAPSPPSPRSPGRKLRTSGCAARSPRTASRRAPVPSPWMIVTWSSPATAASSR